MTVYLVLSVALVIYLDACLLLLRSSLLHTRPHIGISASHEDKQVIVSDKTLEHDFMHWQCLSPLFGTRQAAGFPLDEAKPLVCYGADGDLGVELTILILKSELGHLVAQHKHNAKKTVDPIERFEWIVKQLSADYYQKADSFQSTMTSLCLVDG